MATIDPTISLQQPKDRRPYPQFNSFRPFVFSELTRRRESYPNPFSSPFVRMTSCRSNYATKSLFFTLGLHGFSNSDVDIFSLSYGGGTDIVGYTYSPNGKGQLVKTLVHTNDLTRADIPAELAADDTTAGQKLQKSDIKKNVDATIGQQETVFARGAHPIPGITSVVITRRGVGQPLTADIQYKCYNRAQLEFLRDHFMAAGGTVVIEWGSEYSDYKPTKVLDFSDELGVRGILTDALLKGRSYVIDEWVTPNKGNYDFLVGKIANFNVTLDGKTGVYNCSTTLYSVGEQVWGLNNTKTWVKKDVPTDSNDISKPSTFHDYFLVGGLFDQFIEKNANNGLFVLDHKAAIGNFGIAGARITNAVGGYSDVSSNPEDYRFISWDFFTRFVIPDMMNMIDNPTIRDELTRYVTFFDDSQRDNGVTTPPVEIDQKDWIGDNKFLRSTNPDAMILIKSDMAVSAEFLANGLFGDTFKNERGLLQAGVWLNVGMIRRGFGENLDFESSISHILGEMSSATANYWDLAMIWDDTKLRYRVVDKNYYNKDGLTFPIYKFNVGTQGELLNITFDSAFPASLISQMAMAAQFFTMSKPDKDAMLKDCPSLGTTTTAMFSLNWTNLIDVIEQDRVKRLDGQSLVPLFPSDTHSPMLGSSTTPVENDRSIAKLAGGSMGNVGATAIVQTTGAPPGKKLGDLYYTGNSSEDWENVTVPKFTSPILGQRQSSLLTSVNKYDSLIQASCKRYGADPNLVKAIMVAESGDSNSVLTATKVKETAGYSETALGDRSVGLMQVLTNAHGYSGKAYQLIDPAVNIDVGVQILAAAIQKHPTDIEAQVSSYNGGGKRWTQAEVDKGVGFTLNHNTGEKYYPGVNQFGNQRYVNNVMRNYNFFLQADGKQSFISSVTGNIPVATPKGNDVNGNSSANQPTSTNAPLSPDIEKWKQNISTRFGSWVVNMIELQPSAMINRITRDGYDAYDLNRANGFVAPYPMDTTVTLEVQGISGVSITDCFFVDKLPYVLEKHGVFQVTEISESITDQGWRTKIVGRFKLVWMHGEGQLPFVVSYHPDPNAPVK